MRLRNKIRSPGMLHETLFVFPGFCVGLFTSVQLTLPKTAFLIELTPAFQRDGGLLELLAVDDLSVCNTTSCFLKYMFGEFQRFLKEKASFLRL